MPCSRGWFIVVLVLCSLAATGQPGKELDSLVQILRTMDDDTVKVRTYSRICHLYSKMRTQNDLVRKYADSINLLSEALGYSVGLASAQYYYGGIEEFEGNYDKALSHFTRYLRFHEERADSFRMVNGLLTIAKTYKQMAQFDKALETYYRLVKICELTGDSSGLADGWNSMGGIFREIGKYEEALNHYKSANEIFRASGQRKAYAMGLQNMGNVQSERGLYDSARILYEEALQIVTELNVSYEKAIVLGNLGRLYNKMGQPRKAMDFHLRALPLRRSLPNKRSLTIGLHEVATAYLELREYDEAEAFLNEGLALARELGSKDLLEAIYKTLSELSLARNDFQNAYRYSQLSHQWKDSIFNETTSRQLNELQAKYESEKKDKQITLLAKESELQTKEAERQATQKVAFIVGLILVTVLAGLAVYTLRQKLRSQKLVLQKDNELKEMRFRREMSELELKALRAQINPHFLFNCMNSINRMILEGDNDNASLYLTKFSRLVRLILENTERTRVSLQNELTLLESYIQLEGLRFKGRIDYRINVDDAVDPDSTYLPSMVLQPFVENAIWHGLMHKTGEEKGVIHINMKESDGKLICVIEDNGVGRDKARELQQRSVIKSRSMGMKITEQRLRLLSKERWEQLINITDMKDSLNRALGTRVEINIPVS